mmetsp:Transcript_81571/g.239515  ORF Transcript_81571/g.239515 Transcript_81571/m.239515 type:complete len:130 (-) Transcript_81571:212-601(-)
MSEEEETKKGYDVPLIRLQDSKTALSTDDLDEEERKALAEVSKKGYYHARPKTEEAPPPQRIENPEALQWSVNSNARKRTTFDKFQNKWDKFDKEEPVVKEVGTKEEKSTVKKEAGMPGLLGRCCRRKR